MSLDHHFAGRDDLSRRLRRATDDPGRTPGVHRGTIMRIDAPGLAMAETVACPSPDIAERRSIQCQALTHTLIAALRWAMPDLDRLDATFDAAARDCSVTFIPTETWRESTLSRIHRYGRSIVAMNCEVLTSPLTADPVMLRLSAFNQSASVPVREWSMRTDFRAVGRSVGTTALIGAFSLRLHGAPDSKGAVRLVARPDKSALYWYCS